MNKKISHHDALIYVMVTIAAADRAMTDSELLRIGEIIQTLPIFRDYNREKLIGAAEDCSQMLQDEDGLEVVLDKVAEVLPKKLYETAYALAVEVAAADLHVEQEELRFLQLLRDRLDLDKLTIAAIEAGARARHRIL